MPAVQRFDITEAMKTIFEDPVHVDVVEDSEFMSFIEEDLNVEYSETTGGRYVELAHQMRLGGSAGARSEGDYLPTGNKPKYKNSRIKLRKLQGGVEMTGDVMRRVRNDEGAFLNYMDQALPDCVTRIVNATDRQYIGTGFGIKARVVSVDAGASTIVVDHALGITGAPDAWKQFLEGDSIVFATDETGATIRNNADKPNRFALVGDLDEVSNTLTLEDADGNVAPAGLLAAIQAGDYIFEGDAAGASVQDPADSEFREISGFMAGIDDGQIVASYHNIDRTGAGSSRLWRGNIIDASDAALGFGGQMSEDLLIYADEQCSERGSGKVTNLIMSRSANRGYWKSLKGDRMFVDPRGTYEGGKSDGLPIVLGDRKVTLKVARKLPSSMAFGAQADTWKRWGLGKFEWDDATGSIWNRSTDAVGRQDAFYANGNMYEELGCLAPRKNFRLDNLTAVA